MLLKTTTFYFNMHPLPSVPAEITTIFKLAQPFLVCLDSGKYPACFQFDFLINVAPLFPLLNVGWDILSSFYMLISLGCSPGKDMFAFFPFCLPCLALVLLHLLGRATQWKDSFAFCMIGYICYINRNGPSSWPHPKSWTQGLFEVKFDSLWQVVHWLLTLQKWFSNAFFLYCLHFSSLTALLFSRSLQVLIF